MVQLSNIYKRFLYSFLSLSIVVLLLSPEIQKKPIEWIGWPVGTAVYYMQVGTHSFFEGMRRIWDRYINLVNVQNENEQLRRTIALLEREKERLKEKEILAIRLQELLEFKDHTKIVTTAAAVIGRLPSQWFDTIMINKGKSDGIAVDMGVIAPQGVVGKIIHTGSHYSQVLLATDRNSAISATIQQTRERGIVQGDDAGSARLKYLPHDSKVALGDLLITSGMEGSFSKGLKIGRIKEVKGREEEMFLKIKLAFEVDLKDVEEVLIIKLIEDQL